MRLANEQHPRIHILNYNLGAFWFQDTAICKQRRLWKVNSIWQQNLKFSTKRMAR